MRQRVLIGLVGVFAVGSLAASSLLGVYFTALWLRPSAVSAASDSATHPRVVEAPTPGVATPVVTRILPSRPTVIASPPAAGPGAAPTVIPTRQPPPPAEALIADVPAGRQARSLSCEFQSAADLAWYYGKPYTWQELFLLVGHDPGGNPHKGFVGASLDDPPGGVYPAGYGVYAEPIAAALRQIGLPVAVYYRQPTDWLRTQIARGQPVMVWATSGMASTTVERWTSADGTPIRGARGEHTYLVVGYTSDGVWVVNPWNAQRQFYQWSAFIAAWELFDRMAVGLAPEATTAACCR